MAQDITRRSFVGAFAAAGIAAATFATGCSGGIGASTPAAAAGETASASTATPSAAAPASTSSTDATEGGSVLFVNPSQDRDGNTAKMAADLLEGVDYETLNLVDYKVYPLGADFPDDQFEEVWRRMCSADFLVWGTPVYWHSMSAPTEQALASSETIIGRIVELYGLDLVGTSDSAAEIPALREAILARLG